MNKCLIFNVGGGGMIMRNSGAYRIATILREHYWDVEIICSLMNQLTSLKSLVLGLN